MTQCIAFVSRDELPALLRRNLGDERFNYTTESNILSPVAQVIRPLYQRTLQQGCSVPSGCKYDILANHLRDLAVPEQPGEPVTSPFAMNMTNDSFLCWRSACDSFNQEGMRALEDFAMVTQYLVNQGDYATIEHIRFRQELEGLLPAFEESLATVQRQFPGQEDHPHHASSPKKSKSKSKSKSKGGSDSAVMHPPASLPNLSNVQRFMAAPPRVLARASSTFPTLPLQYGRPISQSFQQDGIPHMPYSNFRARATTAGPANPQDGPAKSQDMSWSGQH
ncbi:hypothetical protein CC86DRAFT_111339 [Ophiobolus disseminans]|uniref:Uncharacterized protein n=1 Tax=Ophiobolus disseminans TaxID=1469910 RepID=A0A6A6ZLX8_9PLEO|nr:hypothetical protein CC86DRAFT_111339 [Ophiobolus disseminans]